MEAKSNARALLEVTLVLSGVVHTGLALPNRSPCHSLTSLTLTFLQMWLEQPEADPAPSVTMVVVEGNCVHSELWSQKCNFFLNEKTNLTPAGIDVSCRAEMVSGHLHLLDNQRTKN